MISSSKRDRKGASGTEKNGGVKRKWVVEVEREGKASKRGRERGRKR